MEPHPGPFGLPGCGLPPGGAEMRGVERGGGSSRSPSAALKEVRYLPGGVEIWALLEVVGFGKTMCSGGWVGAL